MSEDHTPFLAKSTSLWRAHARRPLFVRQVLVVSAAAAILLPILYLAHLRHEPPPTAGAELADARHITPTYGVHLNDGPPPMARPRPGGGSPEVVNVPHLDDMVVSTPHPPQDAPAVVHSPEVIVFALIMWSEHAASEGAILVKSIMMYTSAPVQIHIICDDEAHRYLERRLALVQRPRHDVTVRFYKPTYDQMLARIEREGRISSTHVAGVPGLMKLFIHELLPPRVTRAIFVDTDAFFVSDPLLLWRQFAGFNETTAISLPSHPEMAAPQWFDANKICSCVMLLDLAALRRARLMASSLAPAPSLGHAAFAALFGPPDARTGRYEAVALGDQSFWWAIIRHAPALFAHLPFDWEVSACLLDMYGTGLGADDADAAAELAAQVHTWATPHQGEVVLPKLVHFNCLEGPRYHEWSGWDDAENSLARRWAPTVKYHAGYKWLWLNQGTDGGQVRVEVVLDVKFADELAGGA